LPFRGLVPLAAKEVEMRLLAALIAISALSQTANAEALDCKSISNAGGRLACYDKAAAPVAASAAAKRAPLATPVANVDNGKYVDTIGAEDALMNARLKNICRGC
jgi:hypothetical protein